MSNRIAAVLSIALTMPAVAFTASPAAAAAPTIEQLEKALLAPAQAPTGFTFHSRSVMAASVVPEAVPDPCKATTPKFVDSIGGSATVSFQKGGRDGTTITEAVNAIGAKAAAEQIKRHQTILTSCPTLNKGVTFARWTTPQVGTPIVGFQMTIEQAEGPAEKVITVVVSHNDVLATFTAEAADSAALTAAVTAGVTKIKETV
ncbi:MAG TPA: hypothetical protein VN408_20345 [Actinoplanes sp.]|nr:hypothetical protein [Actinoplanes sp.]